MKVCIVCSDGGRLTEILQIIEAFEGHEFFFITYNILGGRDLRKVYQLKILKKNPLRYLSVIPAIVKILLKEKPDLIISNGAEVAIPTLYIAKLFGIKIIFIESWCRINKPSTTGKLIYPIADVFLVQWRQLLKKYGKKARYEGGIF
ncbi:MAG: capsular biosynthesis protein [Candidatus Neomarinimicrobiota bacterium]|nr:MAG: capsular biosynthesis protein [Candidatus Neomarinimicrobiota bacterium]